MLKFLDEYAEEVLVVFLLAGMTLLVGMQVFMRYIMGDSLAWSEELSRYMFIWLVFIGISFGVKRKAHISINFVFDKLPHKYAAYLAVLADFVFLLFALLVIFHGIEISKRIMLFGQCSPAIELPMWIVYGALPVGFGLVSIRLIQSIYAKFSLIRQGKFEEVK